MKKLNIFKKIAISLSAITIALMLTANFANAAAAISLPYTGPTTVASPVPAFDVFYATPGYPLLPPAPSGSESNFLQGRVPINGDGTTDSTTPYVQSLSTACTNGEIIQLEVYVHNGANAEFNDNGTGPSVAHGTQVEVNIPSNESTSFLASAQISATNAATVNDSLPINCTGGQAVELQYVPGSASQYSFGSNSVTDLSDSIVTTGVPIQSNGVSGDVWACWAERVLVVLEVQVVVPTTPQTPITPQTPTTLVNTGPGNYLGVVAGIASIAGIGYFLRGRYLVRK